MATNLLLIHGNGGANARFQLFLEVARKEKPSKLRIHLPLLPGFEGRPFPKAEDQWAPLLQALGEVVQQAPEEKWVLYGHGVGGSMLLEWAKRGWSLPNGHRFQPHDVIMHSIIGASLQARWFPKVMALKPVRSLIHQLNPNQQLRPRWEKKLFLKPSHIPKRIRTQFFEDYRQCAAFPILFDLITPQWYDQVKDELSAQDYYFLWGGEERVVAAQYLEFWKRDFPKARFEIVPEWDHFPMLETPEAFYHKIIEILDIHE